MHYIAGIIFIVHPENQSVQQACR